MKYSRSIKFGSTVLNIRIIRRILDRQYQMSLSNDVNNNNNNRGSLPISNHIYNLSGPVSCVYHSITTVQTTPKIIFCKQYNICRLFVCPVSSLMINGQSYNLYSQVSLTYIPMLIPLLLLPSLNNNHIIQSLLYCCVQPPCSK